MQKSIHQCREVYRLAEVYQLLADNLPKDIEEAEQKLCEDDWKKFDVVCSNREKMFDMDWMREKLYELEDKIDENDQKFLHDAIDIRQFLCR